ncbi:MAG: flagellar hook-length control protein FliK [Sulfuricellaceae bacterium]|nr:flagellar hook-length control protein FliK [Sulfuricellaceae bacterium]
MEALPVATNNTPAAGKTSAPSGAVGAPAVTDGAAAGAPQAGADGSVGEAFGEVLAKHVGEQLVGIKAAVDAALGTVATDKAAPGAATDKASPVLAVDTSSIQADLSAIIAQLLVKPAPVAEPGVQSSTGPAVLGGRATAISPKAEGLVLQRPEAKEGIEVQLGAKLKALPIEGARFDHALEAAGIAVSGKKAPEAPVRDAADIGKEAGLAAAPNPMAANTSGPIAAATLPERPVVAPQVGSPGWGQAVGQRVVWLVGQQQHTAELQLNPPHLGPLEVRLTIGADQMSATFISQHPAVREAIEAALPRLRDMLADNGIMLGNVNVGAESFMQQQQQQQSNQFAGQGRSGSGQGGAWNFAVEPVAARHVSVVPSGRDGMVDTFV